MTTAEKPTILIFSSVYLPMIGGAELAIRDITARLEDRYRFIVFTARMSRSHSRQERLGGVEVRRLGFGFPFDKYLVPLLAFRAARLELPRGPLLWGMMASYATIAAYFLKRKNPSIPFLLTLQEGDPEEHLLRGRVGFWFRRIVRSADRIQVISEYLQRIAIKAGASARRVDVIPNGVDVGVFGAEQPRGVERDIRMELGIPYNRKIVITASRLVQKNGVDTLIRAMSDVPGEHLIIAGSGPDAAKLKALSRELGIAERVHFIGNRSHRDLARYFAASLVFARPSRSEGLGSAFLEAMAAGLAAIGTPVGGITDFLRHNDTGLVVNVNDAKDLAYQIRHVFYNADFRKKISEAGRALIHASYAWDPIANKMDGVFYRLMNL